MVSTNGLRFVNETYKGYKCVLTYSDGRTYNTFIEGDSSADALRRARRIMSVIGATTCNLQSVLHTDEDGKSILFYSCERVKR